MVGGSLRSVPSVACSLPQNDELSRRRDLGREQRAEGAVDLMLHNRSKWRQSMEARDLEHVLGEASTPLGIAVLRGLEIVCKRQGEDRLPGRSGCIDEGYNRLQRRVVGAAMVDLRESYPHPLIEIYGSSSHQWNRVGRPGLVGLFAAAGWHWYGVFYTTGRREKVFQLVENGLVGNGEPLIDKLPSSVMFSKIILLPVC